MARIMILSHYWHPENGVPQRRWQWLTELLQKHGDQVIAITPPPHYVRKLPPFSWVRSFFASFRPTIREGSVGEQKLNTSFVPASHSLTSKSVNQVWAALSSIRIAIQLRTKKSFPPPDVVIGTVPAIPTALASYATARVWDAPHILDLRDAWPELLEASENWNAAIGAPSLRERLLAGSPLKLAKFIATVSLNHIIKQSDAVVVTTDQHRNDLIKRYTLSHDRVITVRNVFPPALPEIDCPSSSLHHEVDRTPQKTLNVLYAGTVGRAQNLSNAVKAAQIARTDGIDIRLRIIGAGAAKRQLAIDSSQLNVPLEILGKVTPSELQDHYAWADTALVHLTDWPALEKAVPSKTFELMALGIHISGVVCGEAATLIDSLGAGHVVAPEHPELLAALWKTLASDRTLLNVDSQAREWVRQEYLFRGPQRFLGLIENIVGESNET